MNFSSSSLDNDMALLAQQHTKRVGNLIADLLYGFLSAMIADKTTARLTADWFLFTILFGCTCYFGYQFLLQMGHIGMRAVYMAIALFMLLISLLLAYNMFNRAWSGISSSIDSSILPSLPPTIHHNHHHHHTSLPIPQSTQPPSPSPSSWLSIDMLWQIVGWQ